MKQGAQKGAILVLALQKEKRMRKQGYEVEEWKRERHLD